MAAAATAVGCHLTDAAGCVLKTTKSALTIDVAIKEKATAAT